MALDLESGRASFQSNDSEIVKFGPDRAERMLKRMISGKISEKRGDNL